MFYAFDTETVNRPGHGEACLLIRSGLLGPEFLEFPKDFDQIFNFLEGRRNVAWNADFDIRAICHPAFLDFKVVENLAISGRANTGLYFLKYIPGKFLEVYKRGGGKFVVYDLMQFF